MDKIIQTFKEALGDCKRVETSVCLHKTSYEVTSLGFFFIHDNRINPNEPVSIVGAHDNYQLRVKNPNKRNICLIKTDKCLISEDHKKCDCVLLSKDKCFLVEISETCERQRKRNEAIKQLGDTINLLRENGIDLSVYESTAIICFKSGKTRPIQASFTTKKAVFNEQYKIRLEEANFISF